MTQDTSLELVGGKGGRVNCRGARLEVRVEVQMERGRSIGARVGGQEEGAWVGTWSTFEDNTWGVGVAGEGKDKKQGK